MIFFLAFEQMFITFVVNKCSYYVSQTKKTQKDQ